MQHFLHAAHVIACAWYFVFFLGEAHNLIRNICTCRQDEETANGELIITCQVFLDFLQHGMFTKQENCQGAQKTAFTRRLH